MLKIQTKSIVKYLFFFGLIVFFVSCNDRPKGVLNKTDMTEILTEMHKLDGALMEKGYTYSSDSMKLRYYSFILSKHDVSKANFDSSLVWYTKNPKTFVSIYNKVVENLEAQQIEVKSGKYHFIDSVELAKIKSEIWTKKTQYKLTKDSTKTKVSFEIKDSNLMYADVYILRLLLRIAPKDSCTEHHIALRVNYTNGKKDSVYIKTYNDSLLRRYTISLPAKRILKIKSVSGELYGYKKLKGKINATIDSISLKRKFNPMHQDSLRKLVQKLEPKLKKPSKAIKTNPVSKPLANKIKDPIK